MIIFYYQYITNDYFTLSLSDAKIKKIIFKGSVLVLLAKKNTKGLFLCFLIAIPAYFLGMLAPIIGAPVIAILLGMIVTKLIKNKAPYISGVNFTSKKVLHYAIILLGFGLNLTVIFETGKQSLPIIVSTITTSLIVAYILAKAMHIPGKISTLIGIGSSVCGGSAIAAAAPCIDADDNEIARAISVIFFFNLLAALLFPAFGDFLGFSHLSGQAFGVFAGTAINDTSSVTAAASTWDSMFHLGSATLDKAVTVKLTRTLAIIPITIGLALYTSHQEKKTTGKKINWLKVFPMFILYFVLASVITTLATNNGINANIFMPLKILSKFLIVLAMAAIGFNTDVVELVKKSGRFLLLGLSCWIGITIVSLALQKYLGIW